MQVNSRCYDFPMRSRMATDERRAQLIELALRLFSTRGFDDISIDEIAREAGISKGLLYHYFPSKKAFFVAAVEVAAIRLLEATRTAAERDLGDPIGSLRAALDAYLDFVEERATAFRFLMRGGISGDIEVREILDATRERIVEDMLEDVPRTPSALIVARGLLGFIETASLDWLERRGVTRDELRDLIVTVVLQTLAPFVSAT